MTKKTTPTQRKTQKRNQRRRARAAEARIEGIEEIDYASGKSSPIGAMVRTRTGRIGEITAHDPDDKLLEFKLQFHDNLEPGAD